MSVAMNSLPCSNVSVAMNPLPCSNVSVAMNPLPCSDISVTRGDGPGPVRVGVGAGSDPARGPGAHPLDAALRDAIHPVQGAP